MNTRPLKNFADAACQPFYLPGDRHGVLLLHGFTGSAAHMRPLGEGLHALGFTVQGVNLPGHATSMEDMARAGWQDWLDAAKDAFLHLRERCDHVSVAGLSMGGCLSLILAEQMKPTAVLPVSAPMGTKNRLLPLTGLAAPFMPNVWWKQRGEGDSGVDDRYDYGYPGFPTRSGMDLNRLIRMARQDLHAVQCPVLAVQSRADETIAANSAEVIMRGVSSERKGILWLENVPHVCTISREQGTIVQAAAEHFRRAEKE